MAEARVHLDRLDRNDTAAEDRRLARKCREDQPRDFAKWRCPRDPWPRAGPSHWRKVTRLGSGSMDNRALRTQSSRREL